MVFDLFGHWVGKTTVDALWANGVRWGRRPPWQRSMVWGVWVVPPFHFVVVLDHRRHHVVQGQSSLVDGVGVLFSGASDGVRGGGLVVAVGVDGAGAGVGLGVVLCVLAARLAGGDCGDG